MDFGNCWTKGTVSVYLNDVEIASASAATEVTVEFEFHDGFVLKFVELQSIIQFNGFSVIECIGKVVVQLSQKDVELEGTLPVIIIWIFFLIYGEGCSIP